MRIDLAVPVVPLSGFRGLRAQRASDEGESSSNALDES
jgi:hypothetical protein